MFIVRSGLKNKKKFFVNKNSIPLKSSLAKIEKIGKKTFYHYDVFVEIDKRVGIEQDIQHVDVEITSKSLNEINSRVSLLEGVDTKSPKAVNMVATNAQKLRTITTINNRNVHKLSNIGKISSDDVCDSKTASKIKDYDLPDVKIFKNKKRYVLRKIGKNNSSNKPINIEKGRNSSNFLKLHQSKGKSLKKSLNATRKFFKKYNKLTKSGQDPSLLIFKNISNNSKQNSFNFLKGRRPRLIKPSAHARRNILNNSLITKIEKNDSAVITTGDSNLELILENESTRNAVLKQRIKISEKHFLKLKKSELRLMFIAKNKRNVSIDVTEGVINHFEEKKKLSFPNFDFEVDAVKDFRGRVKLTIRNNDNRARRFNVYALSGSGIIPYRYQKFERVMTGVIIKPRQQTTLFRKTQKFSSNRSVFFRVNLVHDGIEYSNTKFCSIVTASKPEETFYGGVTAKCDANKIVINAINLPPDTRRLQILKRNLSRHETNYAVIKNIDTQQRTFADAEITINDTQIFNVTFDDEDVEKNNVYEYKSCVYDENGNKQISAYSYIERYVERKNMLVLGSGYNTVSGLPANTVYEIFGTVQKLETDADKVFKDLFGNFYNLFEDDLKQIRDLNTLTYNLLIEVYRKDIGEVVFVGDISVDKDGRYKKQITLENELEYFVKITPRAIPPAEIIAKINNNLPFYSKKQRFAPVSAFNTAAIKKRIRLGNSRQVSYVGIKYSDKSNRLNSRIVDRKSELNSKNFDLYFDGETGDNVYFDIASKNKSKSNDGTLTISLLNGSVKLIEKNSLRKVNDIRSTADEDQFLASFTLNGVNKSVDFFTMYYKENGNVVTSGLACMPNRGRSNRRINYMFKIFNGYGKIDFFARPVTKDGIIMKEVKIGTVLKDDRGVQ